jgi:hypothetical protein
MSKLWDDIEAILTHDERADLERAARLARLSVEMATRREQERHDTYTDDARLGYSDGRDVS